MKPLVMNLSNQKNQHIVWLDVVRFIAMFTVVCCHCTDPFNFYPGTRAGKTKCDCLIVDRADF